MVLVIVFVFFGLELIVGWRSGVGAWMQEFQKPVVRQLDLSGISSPYAILIQAGSGKTVGDLNGEQQMYPASLTKMMTAIVAIEELKDLSQEITLTQEMFAGLYEQDATQAGFQPGVTFCMALCFLPAQSAVLLFLMPLPVLNRDLWI